VLAISPTTSVLIYSGTGNLALLYEARDAGARGYLLKESPLDDLIRAIDLIARGGSYIDPSLGNSLIQSRGEGPDKPLTGRQIQILRLMSFGQRDADIAANLCISIETVRAHVKRANSRLGVTTRSQAVAEAFRRALIT
jgi:DNA-binding NarL/FixJ family response regulator